MLYLGTRRYGKIHYNIVQCSIVQCGTVHYNIFQYSIVQCGTVQHSTV